jgi:hypothetical protein
MTSTQILVLLALTAYAIYRQSIRHEVVGSQRFKLATIYIVVGLAVGDYYLPPDAHSWNLLLGSLLASAVVGALRGRWTRLWRESDGRVFSQGTPVTAGLFLLLVGGKFALGAWQYLHQQHPHGGFGEVLVLIGLMVALQAEVVWRRASGLSAPLSPHAEATGNA